MAMFRSLPVRLLFATQRRTFLGRGCCTVGTVGHVKAPAPVKDRVPGGAGAVAVAAAEGLAGGVGRCLMPEPPGFRGTAGPTSGGAL
jgi:hypothetical protein